ncbi:MAG: hypothetical protein AABW67_01080 [Nanoarchaeota archaeon]
MPCEYSKVCNIYDAQSLTCSSSVEAQNYCGEYKRLGKDNPGGLMSFLKKGLEKVLG